MAINIWVNRSYSTTFWVLDMLRDNPRGAPVRLFATHVDPSSPVLQAADVAEIEPDLIGDDYVDWALGFCRRHHIDVFLPRLHLLDIARRGADFVAQGVAVLHSSYESMRVLDDKAATYRSAYGFGLPVPPWREVRGADELEQEYASLRAELERDERICLKPTVGVGGLGFRILDDHRLRVSDLLAAPSARVSLPDVLGALRRAEHTGEDVPAFLLMPYLESPEVSVDCLSYHGELLAAVPRTKLRRKGVLAPDEVALDIAERLVAAYGLSYLTNTQLRGWRGEHVLLETNTRPSGGLFHTTLAGVNLAWAAVELALTGVASVPELSLGGEYVAVPSMVALSAGAQNRRLEIAV